MTSSTPDKYTVFLTKILGLGLCIVYVINSIQYVHIYTYIYTYMYVCIYTIHGQAV